MLKTWEGGEGGLYNVSWGQIKDYGLTMGVNDKTSLFLAAKVYIKVRLKK